MIRSYKPKPFDGDNPLPTYVSNTRNYTLIGVVPGGYRITLAELIVGGSTSAGTPLAHALFKSYTDHGERMKVVRTRASGFDREIVAVKSAMNVAGVDFFPALPNSCETILYSLGEWLKANNPDIAEVSVVSQTCH